MKLTPGLRLKSAVCDTEVVIVRPPKEPVTLDCGGAPMGEAGGAVSPEHAGGTVLGKRYEFAPAGLEVLCVKPGAGSLSVGGVELTLKGAKQLPSSD